MSTPANSDYFEHPMFHLKRYTIQTLAMKKLKDDLLQLLWNEETGVLLTGNSGVGKTWAIIYLSTRLETRWNSLIPSFYVSIPERDKGTILSLFRNICYQLNIRVTSRDSAESLLGRIIEVISDRSVDSNCDIVLFAVDEFQRLRPHQLAVFAELHDYCLQLKITLVFLFIGHDPECWPLVELIEQPDFSHIHNRFFNERIKFKGITSHAEVRFCLSEFDRLRFPEDGPSYAEYFTEPGWKLRSLSRDLWRVYHDDFKVKYKIDSWAMKYFMKSVKILLTDFIPEHGIDEICDDMLVECIKSSHLVSSLTSKK